MIALTTMPIKSRTIRLALLLAWLFYPSGFSFHQVFKSMTVWANELQIIKYAICNNSIFMVNVQYFWMFLVVASLALLRASRSNKELAMISSSDSFCSIAAFLRTKLNGRRADCRYGLQFSANCASNRNRVGPDLVFRMASAGAELLGFPIANKKRCTAFETCSFNEIWSWPFPEYLYTSPFHGAFIGAKLCS